MSAHPSHIGAYEVIRLLGRGGMGSVYLARDPTIGRLVAIKLLREGVESDELRERFAREARAAGGLRHPNIVTIFQAGPHEAEPYLVMEYVPGETLADVIKRQLPLTIARRLRIMEEVCHGLAYAHRAGIVHRDVKPANILVDSEGVVRILDFGIARMGEQGLTRSGTVVGSLNYMSPEQIDPGVADHRSDVFAVGLVLYELLTWQKAFPGQDFSVFHRILHNEPAPLATLCADVDPELCSIVDQALRKNPDDRYQDLAAMRVSLGRVRMRLRRGYDDVSDEGPLVPVRATAEDDVTAEQTLVSVHADLDAAWNALDSGRPIDAIRHCDDVLHAAPGHVSALEIRRRAEDVIVREQARRDAEERARRREAEAQRRAEEQARREAEERERREAEERAREEAERARLAAEAEARRQAEEQARREAEERERQEAEARARREAEEQARRAAEEKARQEEAERARLAAEAEARREAEEQARREAEERERREAEEQAHQEESERARLAAAAEVQRQAEERARREAEERERREAQERARQEAEARARREAEEQARREAEEHARLAAEEKAREEEAERARLAEAEARREAEERARLEAEERARQDEAERARLAAEAQALKEAEEQARREAEERERQEAEERARQDAEVRARREAEEQARREAEEQARLAAERARREAEQRAREEAEAQARLDAEEKARREAEARARRDEHAAAAAAALAAARATAAAGDLPRALAAVAAIRFDVDTLQSPALRDVKKAAAKATRQWQQAADRASREAARRASQTAVRTPVPARDDDTEQVAGQTPPAVEPPTAPRALPAASPPAPVPAVRPLAAPTPRSRAPLPPWALAAASLLLATSLVALGWFALSARPDAPADHVGTPTSPDAGSELVAQVEPEDSSDEAAGGDPATVDDPADTPVDVADGVQASVQALRARVAPLLRRGDFVAAVSLLEAAAPAVRDDPQVQRDLDLLVQGARRAADAAQAEADQLDARRLASAEHQAGLAGRKRSEALLRQGQKGRAVRELVSATSAFTKAAGASRTAAEAAAATARTPPAKDPPSEPVRVATAPDPVPPPSSVREGSPSPSASPEPVRPPPPPPPADETPAIRAVLDQFVQGYETLDVNMVRRAWPSAPASLTFDHIRSQSLVLENVRISQQGDTATVTCVRRITQQLAAGRAQSASPATTFTLRKGSAGWVIVNVGS